MAGAKHEAVADAIGCSRGTLEAKFGDELRLGAARRCAEIVGWLFKLARRGNVSALRRLDEIMRAVADAEKPVAARPLGLKAQAQADAETAHEGSSWAELLKPTFRAN